MVNSEEIAIQQDGGTVPDLANPLGRGLALWSDVETVRELWRIADQIAASEVPDCYRGKPANVVMAMEMASTLQVPLFTVLQNVFPVRGNMAFRATFMTTLANMRGPFKHPIRYRVSGRNEQDPTDGKNLVVTAYTVHRDTGELLEATVSYKLAEEEGWTKPDRNGKSKYKTMPEQMLVYRASVFLVRRHCPEVTFGCHMAAEIDDVENSGQSYGASRTASEPKVREDQASAVDALNAKVKEKAAEKEQATDAEVEPVQTIATDEPKTEPEPEREPQSAAPPEPGDPF